MSFWKNKKVLVTGGAGFIGSSIAERLVNNNQVILYDINFKNNSINFTKLLQNKNVNKIEGNILDVDKLKSSTSGVNIIIHTAAVIGVKNVIKSPKDTIEINITGTSNLLKLASEEKEIERFIFFSTSEIFGINAFRGKEDDFCNLGPTNEARWSYSISKIAGEHLTQAYHKEHKLPTVIVRPFNVFGPKRIGEYVIKNFILQALENKPLTIFQDGAQVRSWCYIDDFVDAIISCIVKKEAIGETFNIGNPLNTLTIYELAKNIITLCNSKSKIKFKNPNFTDIDIRVPNIDKVKKILGFNPKVDIDEGLKRTILWYLNLKKNSEN